MKYIIVALLLGLTVTSYAQTTRYRNLYSTFEENYWTTTSGDNELNRFYVYKIYRRDSVGADWVLMGRYNIRQVPAYADWGCKYCYYQTDSWGRKLSYGYGSPEELLEKIIEFLEVDYPH